MAAAGHFPALFLHPILQIMRPTILGVIFVVHRPWAQVDDSDDSAGGTHRCMESGCSLCAVALVGNARSAGELSWYCMYVQGVGKKASMTPNSHLSTRACRSKVLRSGTCRRSHTPATHTCVTRSLMCSVDPNLYIRPTKNPGPTCCTGLLQRVVRVVAAFGTAEVNNFGKL